MKKLCCIFNFAPHYRTSIFLKIDREYDARFFFGDEPVQGQGQQGLVQMDYSLFRHRPGQIQNKVLFGKMPWRSGIMSLPLRFDTFLISGDFNWAYFPFLALCRLIGRKVHAWGHGFRNLKKYSCLKRLYFKWLDSYFVYSPKGKQRMVELGFDKSKIHVIYNSLGEGILPEANRSLAGGIYRKHFGNDLPTVAFIGRLTQVKKLDMLIDVFIEHSIEGLEYNLVIIGDGPVKEKLQQALEGSPAVSRVWFYGACHDESKLSVLLYNADLCVSPGNVGLTALHAMQYGTPVITHDDFETQMPEYETVEEGKTGLLYRAGDEADLKRAVRQWLVSVERGGRHSAALGMTREQVRLACYRVIDSQWNSANQIEILKSVIG